MKNNYHLRDPVVKVFTYKGFRFGLILKLSCIRDFKMVLLLHKAFKICVEDKEAYFCGLYTIISCLKNLEMAMCNHCKSACKFTKSLVSLSLSRESKNQNQNVYYIAYGIIQHNNVITQINTIFTMQQATAKEPRFTSQVAALSLNEWKINVESQTNFCRITITLLLF